MPRFQTFSGLYHHFILDIINGCHEFDPKQHVQWCCYLYFTGVFPYVEKRIKNCVQMLVFQGLHTIHYKSRFFSLSDYHLLLFFRVSIMATSALVVVVFLILNSTIDVSANLLPSSSVQECGKEGMCLFVLAWRSIICCFSQKDWLASLTLTVAQVLSAQTIMGNRKDSALLQNKPEDCKQL